MRSHFYTRGYERCHSLSGAAKVQEGYNGSLTAIVEILTFRAPACEDLSRIIGFAPRSNKEKKLTEFSPFPIWKTDLIVD
jgi:hypothetical protein